MSEETDFVDEEIETENADEDCLSVSWSSSGLCPCCGDELWQMPANHFGCDEGIYQLCDSCGWESEVTYDI